MSDEPAAPQGDVEAAADEEELSWPVGFLIVLALAALYLGWRLIQLLARLIDLIA